MTHFLNPTVVVTYITVDDVMSILQCTNKDISFHSAVNTQFGESWTIDHYVKGVIRAEMITAEMQTARYSAIRHQSISSTTSLLPSVSTDTVKYLC